MCECLCEVMEHAVETGGLRGVFGEREGLGAVHEGVGVRDDLPRGGDAVVNAPGAHAFDIGGHRIGDGLAQGAVFVVVVGSDGEDAGAILLRHVDGAVEEVSETASELLVVAHDDALIAEVGVVAGGDVAHEIVAQTIGRECV